MKAGGAQAVMVPLEDTMERLQLPAEQHFRLAGGAGWRISCLDGLVWITTAGELHDWVLLPGESVDVSGRGILVGTLEPSEVGIEPVAGAAAAPLPSVSAVARWRALLELFARRAWNTPPVGWPAFSAPAVPSSARGAARDAS
nr:MAG: hypothetical protein DIU62_10960 [Pseudomonadota bacterium]